MRLVAILVCVALFGLNAESAMLHVHTGDADSDHHHDGPALHAHQLHVELSPADAQVRAADDDRSATAVLLAKFTAPQNHDALAVSRDVAALEAPRSSRSPRFVVTARAHGPPAGRSCSLRAPPRSHQL